MSANEGGFPADAFEHLAALEPGNYWFESRNRLILWALRKYFCSAGSLLEIGCGTGFVLQAIHAANPRLQLTASDFHENGLGIARARVPSARFVQLDARQLGDSTRYDVIGAFDVLEHIAEDTETLRRMHAATNPGGGVVVTVPQHRWLWSQMDEVAQHVRRYTRRELTDRVRSAGFEPVCVTSFVSLLLPLMALSRWRTAKDEPLDDREFVVGPWINGTLRALLDLERQAIRAGVRWPAGGSLLMVARRR